jgi:hypothetical protein
METNAEGLSGFRFYNAGAKIDEQFPFSISPTAAGFNPEDGKGEHSIGKWNFIASSHAWVFVPLELTSGQEIKRVDFPKHVQKKFGHRGVVMLDPQHDPRKEEPDKPLGNYAVAPTEELVIERAEQLWQEFLEQICRSHIADVQAAMSQGNAPRAAAGFTIHALKECGYRDPAQEYFQGLRAGKTSGVPKEGTSPELLGIVKGLAEQSRVTTQLLIALASGKGVDPELLKAIVVPEVSEPVPSPESPFVRDPSLKARVENRESGYETATLKVGGRAERAKAAAKEL